MPRTKQAEVTPARNPADNALFRKVVPATTRKGADVTIRVAAYPNNDGGKQMTLGIGNDDPTSFSKASVVLTDATITALIKALQDVKKAQAK